MQIKMHCIVFIMKQFNFQKGCICNSHRIYFPGIFSCNRRCRIHIPYLGSPAALYINYISAGKINIFMNFLSASAHCGVGSGWDRLRGRMIWWLRRRRRWKRRGMTAESAMHCSSDCERTLAQPSKQATALLGSPASVLRENCARTVNCELWTANWNVGKWNVVIEIVLQGFIKKSVKRKSCYTLNQT